MSESEGVCISCLETGNVFNIFDTHECEGIEEIYVEMLRSCFDIDISKDEAVNYMCEKCILTLRQAYYFKQNVLKNLKDLKSKERLVEATFDCDILPYSRERSNVNSELNPKTGQLIYFTEESYDECSNYSIIYEPEVKEEEIVKLELLQSVKNEEGNSNSISENTLETEKTQYEVVEEIQSVQSSQEPTQYECAHCEKRFLSKVAIKRHIKTHREGPFPCNICSQVFSKWNTRNSHTWREHQMCPYACPHCAQRFQTFHRRLAHLRDVHGKQKEYPCPYCDNVYNYAGARSQHIRATHLRVHNHHCTECKMAFFKRRALLSHLASIHGIGEKKFVCPICSKSFYRKPILYNHMKTHIEKPKDSKLKCSVCAAEFTHQTILKNHMRCHALDSKISRALHSTNNTQDSVVIGPASAVQSEDNTQDFVIEKDEIVVDDFSETVYFEVQV